MRADFRIPSILSEGGQQNALANMAALAHLAD
jgi:hypothetical protein